MNIYDLCPADLCAFAFMRRALVAAALVGLAAPAIGVFLVQRRLSLMGDGIGHVALTGVAAGFLLGTSPLMAAMVTAVLGAVVIELLRQSGRTAGDVALAVIFYGGIAGGALILSLAGTSATNTLGYLFGALLSIGDSDLVAIALTSAGVLALVTLLRKSLFAICYDEEAARASGLPVRALNLLVAIVAALTIGVAMRVVGILLVSAMLVLPVASAQQLARSFRATFAAGLVIGLAVSVGGLVAAYFMGDAAPGATIVVLAIAVFVAASAAARVRRTA